MDYIAAGRLSFHPVDSGASYSMQKAEGDAESTRWSKTKMPVWLQHFEKVVKRANGGPVAGGPHVTHADFALFHVLDATAAQFLGAWDTADVPSLKRFHAEFSARPKLVEYFESPRRLPWAGDSMM